MQGWTEHGEDVARNVGEHLDRGVSMMERFRRPPIQPDAATTVAGRSEPTVQPVKSAEVRHGFADALSAVVVGTTIVLKGIQLAARNRRKRKDRS